MYKVKISLNSFGSSGLVVVDLVKDVPAGPANIYRRLFPIN